MSPGIREVVGWVFSFAVLLIIVFASDRDIGHRLSRLGGDVLGVRWSSRLSALGDALVDVVPRHGIEGGLLATFLVVTVMLVWLMVRS